MLSQGLNIQELATQVGLTRRAVRFYVQRGMIPPPEGRGRGSHYGTDHLKRLRRIQELQDAGHSLEMIGKILNGEVEETSAQPSHRPKGLLNSELWTRVKVAEGIELHLDATLHRCNPGQLIQVRQALQDALFHQNENTNTQDQS